MITRAATMNQQQRWKDEPARLSIIPNSPFSKVIFSSLLSQNNTLWHLFWKNLEGSCASMQSSLYLIFYLLGHGKGYFYATWWIGSQDHEDSTTSTRSHSFTITSNATITMLMITLVPLLVLAERSLSLMPRQPPPNSTGRQFMLVQLFKVTVNLSTNNAISCRIPGLTVDCAIITKPRWLHPTLILTWRQDRHCILMSVGVKRNMSKSTCICHILFHLT
jgi:hypothetical protein